MGMRVDKAGRNETSRSVYDVCAPVLRRARRDDVDDLVAVHDDVARKRGPAASVDYNATSNDSHRIILSARRMYSSCSSFGMSFQRTFHPQTRI